MSLFKALCIQQQVIEALLIREMKTRYGQSYLGYLWAFLEPILWIAIFYGIFSVAQRSVPYGMDIGSFIASGIIPFQLILRTINMAKGAVEGNKSLLYYPQVKPIDLILARSFLEVITLITVFIVILTGNYLLFHRVSVYSWPQSLGALLLGGFLAFSFGAFLCGLTMRFKSVDKVYNLLRRPLFFISGIFFLPSMLPLHIQKYFQWNPIAQVIDIVRDGVFSSYHTSFHSISYVFSFAFISLASGLWTLNTGLKKLRFS